MLRNDTLDYDLRKEYRSFFIASRFAWIICENSFLPVYFPLLSACEVNVLMLMVSVLTVHYTHITTRGLALTCCVIHPCEALSR
jgi:hypothetical protein